MIMDEKEKNDKLDQLIDEMCDKEFSTDFNKNEAKSSETVENHVENVENLVCTEASSATITNKTPERDGDRHIPTPKLIKGVV